MDKKEFADYLELKECRPSGDLLKTVGYKPKVSAAVMLALGIVIVFSKSSLIKIFGVFLILAGLYIIFIFKDRKVMELYSDGILIYDDRDQNKAVFRTFDSIKKWSVKKSSNQTQAYMFILQNGQYIYKETFQAVSAKKYFAEHMPDKEFQNA